MAQEEGGASHLKYNPIQDTGYVLGPGAETKCWDPKFPTLATRPHLQTAVIKLLWLYA